MALNEYDELLSNNGEAPAANEYDALLADDRGFAQTRLRQAMTAAAATEPDRAARALEHAERLRLPRSVVERNLDVIERRDTVERNDYDALLDKTPQLAAWLTESPDNAAIARDDLDTLGNFEALTTALARGYTHGEQTNELGRLGIRLADGDRDPTLVRRVAALERDLAAAPGGRGFMAQWVYPASKVVGQLVDTGVRSLNLAFGGAIAGGTAAAIAGQLGPQVAAPEEVVTVPAAAALGFGAGLKAGFAADVYAIEAGHAYLELSRVTGQNGERLDESTKRAAAAGVGLINAALEYAGVRLLAAPWKAAARKFTTEATKDLLVTPTLRRAAAEFGKAYATAVAGEVATEVMQEGTNLLAEELAKMATDGEFERLANSPAEREAAVERLFAIASETFRGMALVGLPGASVNLAADVRNVSRARENQRFFEALGQTAEASKLRERLPAKLQEFVGRATADGPVENVYIPVEAFAQYFQGASVDPRTIAAELLGDAKAYDEAARTGEDLRIPTAIYAAKLAGTEHHKALAPDLRLAPNEMTARESEAFLESLKKEAGEGQADAGASVREDVLGQLLGIGYERATAEAYADLYASTFRTLGQRAGVDPMALYQRYGLKIDRPLPDVLRQHAKTDALDVLIDRIRKGDVPADRDVHGPSLLDFLVAKGGLQDQGGELAARDARLARRGLVRDTGRTLDDAAEQAVEAGYLDVRDPNLLLERIGAELRGEPVYAPGRGNAALADVRAAMDQLTEYLGQLGIDVNQVDNAAIKKLLHAETETPGARELEQGALVERIVDRMKQFLGLGEDKGAEDTSRDAGRTFYQGVAEQTLEQFLDARATERRTKAQQAGLRVALRTKEGEVLPGEPGRMHLHLLAQYGDRAEGATFGYADQAGKFYTRGEAASAFAVTDSRELFQRTIDDKRGAIAFGDDRQFTIKLFEKADLSTFLHESGHFYLEVLGDLATLPGAPEGIAADYATILKWLGVESREQIGMPQHEQFARGFEAYLREGKAPAPGLRAVFAKFRAWLVAIYRSLARLDVELTDEVRDVMDRLIATEEEIAAAEQEAEVTALFTDAAAAGMTDVEFAAYRQTVETAHHAAAERLQGRLLTELRREQEKWWADARERVRAEVAEEVNRQPVYQAHAFLGKGTLPDGAPLPEGVRPFKLDRRAIADAYGADFAKRLPRGITAVAGAETPTLHPDQAAEAFGFTSGEELLMTLANMRPREALIEAETDARLKERYGDLLLDGTALAAAASQAVHGPERAKVIEAELKALRKKAREVRPFVRAEQQKQAEARRTGLGVIRGSTLPIAQIRAMAEGIVSQKRARDVDPSAYLMALRRAAKRAVEAAAKDDYEVAAAEKQRELLNLELYRAALAAREETDGIAEYMGRFAKTKTRERIGKAGADYLEQIDGLLERFEFKRVSLRAVDRRQTLIAWIEDKQAKGETLGEELAIPERLLSEAYRTNYRNLTVEELRGLRDSVKQIEHFARLKNKLLTAAAERAREDAKVELLDAIETNVKDRGPPPLTRHGLTPKQIVAGKLKAFDASLVKMEQLVEWLDGGKLDGPWHRYLWDGAAAAQAAELDYAKRITAKIAEAVINIPEGIRKRMRERVTIAGVERAITRKDLIGVALNVGNESNYQKLLKGMNWTEAQVRDMVDRLTADEIAFVNELHATLESMWPDIAKLQKELTGLEPEKIAPREFAGANGTIKGGYYPIMYDPLASEAGQLQLAARVGGLVDDGYTRATTPKGHTKARVEGFARPFNLDIDDLAGHIAGVVKDLTHRKWLIDANWLVNDREIRAALRRRLGDEYVGLFPDWVRSVVNDRHYASMRSLNIWRRMVEHARYNVMIASMGFKAATMASQLAGLGPAIEVIGGKELDGRKYLGRGFAQFMRAPVEAYRTVTTLSGEMRHRLETRDRDLRDKLRLLAGREDYLAQVQNVAMRGIAWADMMVSLPTWLGAYQKALDQGATQELAIKAGDRAVRLSQGAGGQKDLASVMAKSGDLMRLFTMFYTPFNALYNRLRTVGRDVHGIKDVPQAAIRLWWVWLVPAVMGELLTGRGPDDDDDKGEWALRQSLIYLALGVPILRDIVGGTLGEYGYQLSPVAQVGDTIARTIKKAGAVAEGSAEIDELIKPVLKTTGYLLGLPTGQAQITGEYIYDLATGEADPEGLGELAYGLLYRRRDQ